MFLGAGVDLNQSRSWGSSSLARVVGGKKRRLRAGWGWEGFRDR